MNDKYIKLKTSLEELSEITERWRRQSNLTAPHYNYNTVTMWPVSGFYTAKSKLESWHNEKHINFTTVLIVGPVAQSV